MFINMEVLLTGTSILIILTKLFDCLSTQRQIRVVSDEQNPIGRWLMRKLGAARAIWLIWIVHVLVVGGCHWFAATTESPLWKWSYPAVGISLSVILFAVGMTNVTRRLNVITRPLMGVMRRFR